MQGAAPGCDHPVTASLLSHTFPPTFSLVCMSSQQAVVPPGNTYLLWCSSWRPIYSGMASPTGHPTGESQLSGEPSLCSFSHLGLHRVASHASLHLTLRSAAFLPSLKACFAEALPSWLLGPAVPWGKAFGASYPDSSPPATMAASILTQVFCSIVCSHHLLKCTSILHFKAKFLICYPCNFSNY